jgi:hypothetical protein
MKWLKGAILVWGGHRIKDVLVRWDDHKMTNGKSTIKGRWSGGDKVWSLVEGTYNNDYRHGTCHISEGLYLVRQWQQLPIHDASGPSVNLECETIHAILAFRSHSHI